MRISSLSLRLRHLLLGTSALTGFALASTAQAGQAALPTSGVVTVGSATIAQSAPNQLNITTGTSRTVIDWQSFSIGNGNKVAIQQPGSNSITVNEVTGNDPSQIFGALSSNGRVVLANPNGIWFGPNSHVDVAGLVASTATLSADAKKAFAAGGRLSLDTAGNPTASIVNDGHITVAGEGLAALVAPGVRNNGVIEATLGSVTLASGETSTLDFYGDGLVSMAVTSPVQALAIGPDGKPFTATIENKGKIAAQHVLVTADVVKGVVDNSINMSGVVEAKGVTVSGGDIVLDGGEGDVTVSGKLDVTSQQATGGTVQVTGGTVTVASTAKIDASGAKGGGTIQIGGGPHGGGNLKHATNVLVQGGSAILANATVQGDGGTVSIWSDEQTVFGGSIEAKGAGLGGNGGWVETSGHLLSLAGGTVDTTAPFGTTGIWLLDPFLVDIIHAGSTDGSASTTSYTPSAATTITDADLNSALGSSNVSVQTSGAGGAITVEPTAVLAWGSSSTLTLATTVSDATGTIAINGTITAANGGLTLTTSGTVSQTAAISVDLLDLTGTGGTFNLATVVNSANVLAANTGAVNLNDNGLIGAGLTIGNLNGTTGITTTGAATISATQAGGITNTSTITSGGGLSLSEGSGTINLDAAINVTSGTFTINTNGTVAQTAAITTPALELLGAGGAYNLTQSNQITTLAANTGSVTLGDATSLTIGTAGGTTGIQSTGTVTLAMQSGGVTVAANVSTTGGFLVTLPGNDTFSESAGVSIIAGGQVDIDDVSSSASTITILGTIMGTGIDIEATSPTGSSGGGSGLTIGAAAHIENTGLAVQDGPSAASMVFYSGTNPITFDEGAQVIADVGNIAFITNSFVLNAPSATSTVSAPLGTVIYSPATTSGTFAAPTGNLSFSGSENFAIGSDVTTPTIAFLSGQLGGGGNVGTVGALQIGLPGNTNTTSVSSTITLPISTTIYGSTTSMGPPSLSVGASITADAGLILSAFSMSITAPITLTATNGPGVLTLNASSTVTQSAAITAPNLELMGGSFTLTNASNDIGVLATNAGSVTLNNGGNPLTIGLVDMTSGVTTSGALSLANLSGNLLLAGNVSVGSGSLDLSAATTGATGITIGGGLGTVVAISAAASGASITLGPIDGTNPGEQSLTVSAGVNGQITLAGDIGDLVQLGSLTVGTNGGEVFLPSNVSTMGTQSYMGNVLVGNGGITATNINAVGDVDFANTLDGELGSEIVTINAQGAVNFAGAIGSQDGLGQLNVTAGSISAGSVILQLGALSFSAGVIALNTAVTTSGSQIYAGPVTVAGQAGGTQVTLTGGNIQFINAIAGVVGDEQLTIDASGTVAIGGPINNLSALTVTGTSIALGGSVTTSGVGNQTYTGPVTFGSIAPVNLQSGGSIIFNGSVDGAVGLALDAMSSVSLGGSIGANTPGGLSNLQISGSTITLAGAATTSGSFEADFASGGLFTSTAGASITSGANVIIDAVGSNAASSISIGGSISAAGIYLLAADHGTGASGTITLNSGGGGIFTIQNTQTNPSVNSMEADTIFYAGPGGTINVNAATNINGGQANIAFLADTLMIATNGTPSTISTTGRVILAPGSTAGLLEAGTGLPYTQGGQPALGTGVIDFAVPGGGTAANLTVGGATGIASQANLNFLSGGSGSGDPVNRLQIGLAGNTGTTTIAGAVNFLTDTSLDAQNFVVAAGAVLTNSVAGTNLSGISTFSFGTAQPDGLTFVITETAATTTAGATFAAGSSINYPVGQVQVTSMCADGACTVQPQTSFAGSISAASIVYMSGGQSDAGFPGDTVSIASTASLTALGTLDPNNPTGLSSIVFQTGRHGSLAIAGGATINASTSELDFYTDALTFTGTGAPIISASFINIDTGTADSIAFPGAADANGNLFQEEPIITLGAPAGVVAGLGLDLSSATLATLAGAVGTTQVLIGDESGAPVLITAVGNVTLPTNTTITGDAFNQMSGTTISTAGTLTINARTPTNIQPADAQHQIFGPATLPQPTVLLAGNVTTGGALTINAGGIGLGGVLTSAGGGVDFEGNVTLIGSSSVSIGSGGADIDFNGTLQGQTSRQNGLTLTAGSTGNINFNDLVGNGGLQLGAVNIVSADNVTGPAVNSTSLAGGTSEFQAASFSAGSSNAIAGGFTMLGGLSTAPGTNALTTAQTSGAITINAAGAVTIGTLNTTTPNDDLGVSARGADISSSTANTTGVVGNGGSISITGSSLTLADVTARGGEAKSGSVAVTNGGSGGTIFLDAASGNVTVLGGFGDPGVSANGGESTLASGGVGGNAGSVLINAANGNVNISGAYANGGGVLGGVGGNGGSIIIDALTISLERALAIGGDTQATGTGTGGGTGGLVNLMATGNNAIEITLGGNSSDLSGSATASTFGTVSARGGEVGVTNVFGADQGGTVTGAGGSVLIEGAQGAALGGLIELVNTSVAGGTAIAGTLSGGANVVISASGVAGHGGLVDILGSFAAADDGVEGLRLGATNGVVDVNGSVGIKGGNTLNQLVLTGNGGAITIGGDVVTSTLSELRTSGSLTLDGDLKLNTYTTPLGNTVLLDFPGQAGGSSSGSGNAVSISGTFLLATPLMLEANAITLIGTTVFDSSTTNAALTLGSVDGAFSLTLNAGTGSVTAGAIGAQTALSSLTITGGSINLGAVTTTGAQTYTGPTSLSGSYNASVFDVNGATTLAGTSTVTASTAAFGGTIDGTTSGGQSLTIDATTSGELGGAIGGTVQLDNFTLNAASVVGSVPSIFVTGTEMINLSGAFYSGSYSFTNFINSGSMVLSGDTIITATAGNITIGGTVDGAHALSLIDMAGTITIDGVVGGSSALTSLTLTSNNAIVLGGTITTTGAQSYTGPVSLAGTIVGGSFAVNGATTLTGAAAVTTSGNITFGGTVDGAQSLVLNAGSAAAAIQGATGAQVALGGLAITAGTITVGNVATSGAQTYNGPLFLSSVSTLQSAGGGLTFGSTISGTQSLTLGAGTGNISFDGTLSTQADPTALTILSGDNVTVFNNSTLWVTNFLGTITGTFTFGNHSLDSDDVVSINAGSVDGRVTTTSATGSVTIDADSVTGIINGDTVSVTATGAVSEQITGGAVSVDSGSFSGAATATRSANIAASGDVAANVTVSGGSASVSGANVSGSVTASGLAQIAATQDVSADVTGGSVAISAPSGTVSGAVTSTSGGITIAAGNVSSTIVAEGGGSVDVTASGSITGSVSGGAVSLTAPVVNASLNASSANITADSSNITGTIGGNDASSVVAASSNVTQTVLGATREVANGGDNGTAVGDDQGGDDASADGDSSDDKKKKAKDKGAVYDYANQYIDNLISGKPAH